MRNADPEHDHIRDAPPPQLPPAVRAAHLLPDHTEVPMTSADIPESFGTGRGAGADVEAFGIGAQNGQKQNPRGEQKKDAQPENRQRKEKQNDEPIKEEGDDKGEPNATAGEEAKEKNDKTEKEGAPDKPPVYKRTAFKIGVVAGLLLIAAAGIAWWLYARQFAKTDDAYIEGHVTQMSAQVSGTIKARHIDDNQFVKMGDLLVELDATDYLVALEQARAAAEAARGRVEQAQSQIAAAHAAVQQNDAEIAAAQVQLDNATRDLQRYQSVDPLARSQQQLDNAAAAQKNAAAQLDQTKARKASSEANVKTAEAAAKAAQGDLDKALADVHRAEVNVGYCSIYAPSDGRVTSRTIEAGTYVNAGQVMFALVAPDVWVTANYKETQLTHMRIGQPVTIKVDAYPGIEWRGHVDSIQAGSGSRFSVLPAENATGNFVKIVQRVPVKIVFDPGSNTDDSHLLSPGMSVEPKVKIR